MMRCKKHPYDVSSCVGVCAACLRERLFILIAAQEQAEAQLASTGSHAPPPMIFPRSVSPYVSRRKSDDTSSATWQHHHHHHHHHHRRRNSSSRNDQRFFSTPQVGPTYDATTGAPSNLTASRSCRRKSASGKFSVFSNFFAKSRSRMTISDLNYTTTNVSSRDSCAGDNRPSELNNSPSWFSSLFPHRRRKKQSRLFSMEDSAGNGIRRPVRALDRGMSPERGFENDCDQSPSCSDYTSESWKNTPTTAAATPWSVRRSRQCQVKNMSSLTFCLSPLVRPSPSRLWSQKSGSLVPDMSFSGELRGSAKPHLASAASFCSNRSRKLVDIGKVNHNR